MSPFAMHRWSSLFVLIAASLLSAAHLRAAQVIVNVGGSAGLAFNPQTITVQRGDIVTFVNKGGFHNVVADDGSFRCARGCDGDGHNGNGSASNTSWIANVPMTQTGTIGYFCEIHGMPGAGMFGTIIVQGAAPPPTALDAIPASSAQLLLALVGGIALIALLAARRRS